MALVPWRFPNTTRGVGLAKFPGQLGDQGPAISLDMTPKIDKITNRNEHVKVNLS